MSLEAAWKEWPTRTRLCGFDVAATYYPGLAIFLLLPVAAVFFVRCVLLSPELVLYLGDHGVALALLVFLLLFLLVESLLLLVMVADPGFVVDGRCTATSYKCPVCECEVDEFDHHCGVLGACIGRGNMHYFVSFLIISATLCWFWFAFSVLYVVLRSRELDLVTTLRVTPLLGLKSLVTQLLLTLPGFFATGSVLVTTHVGVFSTGMSFIYTFLCARGLYALQRRRQRGLRGGCKAVFAGFFRPHLTPRVRHDADERAELLLVTESTILGETVIRKVR